MHLITIVLHNTVVSLVKLLIKSGRKLLEFGISIFVNSYKGSCCTGLLQGEGLGHSHIAGSKHFRINAFKKTL